MAGTLCVTLCVFSLKKSVLDMGKLRERRTCWPSGLSRDCLEEPRCGSEPPPHPPPPPRPPCAGNSRAVAERKRQQLGGWVVEF